MPCERRLWKVVGGVGTGGILVREGHDLRSLPLSSRLSTDALLEELELRGGQRLHFCRLRGAGPKEGWVSIKLNGKDLVVRTETAVEGGGAESADHAVHDIHGGGDPGGCNEVAKVIEEAETKVATGTATCLLAMADATLTEDLSTLVRAALSQDATPEVGNAAMIALFALQGTFGAAALQGQVLLARGLVFWRWHMLDRALLHLSEAHLVGGPGASSALLALEICLGRWPEARQLAEKLHQREAISLVDGWTAGFNAKAAFSPGLAEFASEEVEVMPGIRQIDARLPTLDDVELGVRLFLQVKAGKPQTAQPLILYFHGNGETVDTYKDPEVFEPLRASGASALVVDFRGYGFSRGGDGPSLALLHVDAERICDAMPSFFSSRGLPWPWPGGLTLFGRSMGGRIACHLASTRAKLFTRGVVLESAMCGSHKPGADRAPEPLDSPGSLGGGSGEKKFSSPELDTAVASTSELCHTLVSQIPWLAQGDAHFVYMLGNEDKIRGYGGRLLILHGELDTIIPVSHARRLCDAATSATRRLVTVAKGHNDISASSKYLDALKKFLAGS